MHVLLLEPDLLQATMYRQALEKKGYQVCWVRSAQAAVHAADEHMPDIIVIELQISGHNGIEFLYEFRSYQDWLTVPIIIHSFVAPHELTYAATLSHELGVKRILYKPTTTLADLCAAVNGIAPIML